MGKEQIDYEKFFGLAENHYGIRGHEKKLTKVRSRPVVKVRGPGGSSAASPPAPA